MKEFAFEKVNFKGSIIPVVEAYLTKSGDQLAFFCPYCKCWHYHGPMEGNRGAHCHVDDVPWRQTGYYLRCVGNLTAEIKKSVPKLYKS
jgi:hypothetical protein